MTRLYMNNTSLRQPAHSTKPALGLTDLVCLALGAAFFAAVPVAGLLWSYGASPFAQAFFVPSLIVIALAFAAARQLSQAARKQLNVVPPMICAGVALPLALALSYGVVTYTAPIQPYGALANAAMYGPAPALLPAGRLWYSESSSSSYEPTCIASGPTYTSPTQGGSLQRVSTAATVSTNCAPRPIKSSERIEARAR